MVLVLWPGEERGHRASSPRDSSDLRPRVTLWKTTQTIICQATRPYSCVRVAFPAGVTPIKHTLQVREPAYAKKRCRSGATGRHTDPLPVPSITTMQVAPRDRATHCNRRSHKLRYSSSSPARFAFSLGKDASSGLTSKTLSAHFCCSRVHWLNRTDSPIVS